MPAKSSPDAERHKICFRCRKWFEPDEGSMVRGERWRPLDWLRAMVNIPRAQAEAFICFRCQRVRAAAGLAIWVAFVLAISASLLAGWLSPLCCRPLGPPAVTEEAETEETKPVPVFGWLSRNQELDGSWSIRKHGGTADERNRVAVTGLALLSFLGSGFSEGVEFHKPRVQRAISFLISQQDDLGQIGENRDRETGGGLNHAIAGLALSEAYNMAKVPATGRAAQKALDWSSGHHQVKGSGWGHSPRGEPDLAVTVWFVMQLKSGQLAGLEVPGSALLGAADFVDSVVIKEGQEAGLCSSRPGQPPNHAMTAAGMLCRQLLMWWTPEDPVLVGGAKYLEERPPGWEDDRSAVALEHWFHGTMAICGMGRNWWKHWNEDLRHTLIDHQRKGGPEDGSWDPPHEGLGRAWSTAMAALCLEVYYRYLPIWQAIHDKGTR